jgi:plasmid maintenance system antidote protein VapI
MTNKEKFLALVSKEETRTVERAKERIARKNYTRLSQKIALSILIRLDELGWKQVTLAEKMGVSAQQVNKWVKGKENFTIETLTTLNDVLGFNLITVSNDQDSQSLQIIQLEINDEYEVSSPTSKIATQITLHSEMTYDNDYLIAQ